MFVGGLGVRDGTMTRGATFDAAGYSVILTESSNKATISMAASATSAASTHHIHVGGPC